MDISLLPLFVNAKVVEISTSFAGPWYRKPWKDIEKIGPQLTTLRMEVIEGVAPVVARSMKKLVEARLEKGMPLAKLGRRKGCGKSSKLVLISASTSLSGDRNEQYCSRVSSTFAYFLRRGCLGAREERSLERPSAQYQCSNPRHSGPKLG